VVEIPPVMPPDAAGALDLYQARAVIDGRDFGVREFHASGALLKQQYSVVFRLIRRDRLETVSADTFAIQPGPADVVLEGDPSDDGLSGVLSAALREIARLKGSR
jgi:hypothetical protein